MLQSVSWQGVHKSDGRHVQPLPLKLRLHKHRQEAVLGHGHL